MAFNEKDDDVISDINMTPLIDIMLVLLIIFMVTASVATDQGLDIKLPETVEKSKYMSDESVAVYIDSKGSLFIEKEPLKEMTLVDAIKREIINKKSGFVILKGDKNARLETILQVMDAANKSGATRFAIATEEKN